MKNAYLLAALASLSLTQSPAEAQSFQAHRPGGNFQAAGRGRTELKVQINLGARQHLIQEAGDNTGTVRVREVAGAPLEGGNSSPRVGLPDLSMRMTKVLLPYEASGEGMELKVLSLQLEDLGVFDLAPVDPAEAEVLGDNGETFIYRDIPEGVQLDDEGRDLAAYSAQVAIPDKPIGLAGMGGRRGYRYARISFSPFRWNPQTKVLSKVVSVQAEITCKRRQSMTRELRARELGDPVMQKIQISEELLVPPGTLGSYLFPPRDTDGDYLIITTNLIRTTSTQLGPFIDMKEDQGHDVFVKTVEEIESEYPSSSRADSMRRFLRAEYQDLGVHYLLLLGDPDPDDQGDPTDSVGEVPMLMAWPGGAFVADLSDDDSIKTHRYKISPTDLYYTELTEPCWDLDGDGFPAEYDDDRDHTYYSSGGHGFHVYHYPVDFDEELSGARIPFSEVSVVDDHLAEQIHYQTDTPDFFEALVRRRVVLAMAEFAGDTWFDTLGRQIKSDLGSFGTGIFAAHEMYEYPSYDAHMEEDALADEWSDLWGAGMVIWSGHGNEDSAVVNDGNWTDKDYKAFISGWDSSGLTTTFTRSMVISISCLNARPSFSSNITHDLMEDAAVGMFSHTGVMFYTHPRTTPWGDESWGADTCYLISKQLTNGVAIGDTMSSVRRSRCASSRKRVKGLIVITAYGDPSCKYLY